LGIVLIAKVLRKPVVFYAQGIGPVNTLTGRILVRLIVNRVNLITVRDDKSREELFRLRVTRPPIKVTADPVLAVKSPEEVVLSEGDEKFLLLNETFRSSEGLIGVFFREWERSTVFKEAAAKVCDDLARNGWEIVFVPMHFPGDLNVSKEISGIMEEKSIVLEKQFSFPVLLKIISEMDLIIGMRLHSLVFAAAAGVPLGGVGIRRWAHRH